MSATPENLHELNDRSTEAAAYMNEGAAMLNTVFISLQEEQADDGLLELVNDMNEKISEAAEVATARVEAAAEEGSLEEALRSTDFTIEQQLSVLPDTLDDLLDLVLDVPSKTRGLVALAYAYYLSAYQSATAYQEARFPHDEEYFLFLESAFLAGNLVSHPLGSEA